MKENKRSTGILLLRPREEGRPSHLRGPISSQEDLLDGGKRKEKRFSRIEMILMNLFEYRERSMRKMRKESHHHQDLSEGEGVHSGTSSYALGEGICTYRPYEGFSSNFRGGRIVGRRSGGQTCSISSS